MLYVSVCKIKLQVWLILTIYGKAKKWKDKTNRQKKETKQSGGDIRSMD